MKINTAAFVAMAAAAAATVGVAAAPFASADTEVRYLGQPGELVNGTVIQHWTITGLKPSTDSIGYRPAGTLWEATATDEAVSGYVTPIISDLNARARNGETYRVLFGVATPQGVNPSTLAQGQKTTGKIYFDVTGEAPDSVLYRTGGNDLLLWVEPPPAPATGYTGGSTAPAQAAPITSDTAEAAPADTAPTAETPAPTPAPATPLQEGSTGTPLPEGSSGTPLPEGAAAAPEGSSGTPIPDGSATTAEIPGGSAPTPTAEVPAPPA